MANPKHAEDDPKHGKLSAEITAVSSEAQPAAVPSVPGRDGGVAPCVPSFAAASELLSAPYSCLVLNTHRRHITLPPVYMYKKRTGIKEELDTELLRFSQSLKGVPMAYDNIRIVSQHGNIYDDSGYIHMDIEANFIVFQPVRGEKLVGKVNKLGMSHVGCLVHGCFNASIPKPNLVSVETWRDAGPRIDSELEFEVTALDADIFGVLLIRGRLDRTRVQELLALGESSASNVTTDQAEPSETEPTAEPAEESPADTPKKKKKKKKKKVKEEQMEEEEEITSLPTGELESNVTQDLSGTIDEVNNEAGERKKKKKKKKVKEEQMEEEEITSLPTGELESNVTQDLNGTIDEVNSEAGERKKKKKKKKKEKVVKEEEEEIELSHMELQGGSDSSGYLSDKPKKRKHEDSTDATPSLGESTELPKSKKKRRSEVEQFA